MKTIIIDGVEYNLTPKVQFKKGDWVASNICNSSDLLHIINVDDKNYEVETSQGNTGVPSIAYVDSNFHLYDVTKDAKDGDILVASDESVFIYSGSTNIYAQFYIALSKYGDLNTKGGNWEDKNSVHPATKEQRDTLMKAMADGGYTFDFEKKELKEIEDGVEKAIHEAGYEWSEDTHQLKKIEQEPLQWNISDYKTWQYIVSDVLTKHDGIGQYLDDGFCKKIAQYMQEEWSKKLSLGQNLTWSEEDEEYFYFLEKLLENLQVESTENEIKRGTTSHSEYYYKVIQWLKSLRPQNTWKPIGEQISCLARAINRCPSRTDEKILGELLKQLNKQVSE